MDFAKSKPKPGSFVKLELNDGRVFKGLVLPRPESYDQGFLSLKLGSGYNIGINLKNIKRLEILKDSIEDSIKDEGFETPMIEDNNVEDNVGVESNVEKKTMEKAMDNAKPLIAIIHTGGTIASRVDYNTGAVISETKPEYLLKMVPELSELANINTIMVSNILSENMRFEHYNKILDVLERVYPRVSGIIIGHGTDTLHYTSSALSFALDNLSKPIVLVGAQRSSDRPSSDAWGNLLAATLFITKTYCPGVFVCMHSSKNDEHYTIFRGVNLRKMHTSSRDAFKQINNEPIADVNIKTREVVLKSNEIQNTYKNKSVEQGLTVKQGLIVKRFDPKIRVGFLKVHPNMTSEEVAMFKGFDGVVIEGTGLGHMPIQQADDLTKENIKIKQELSKLIKESVVVMTSQCISGRINMNVYSTGRCLKSLGVIGDLLDMTPETAFIKLSWLLSNYNREEVIRLFNKNLRGEITYRTVLKQS